ncbi:TAXI family TRAP transporter solute-binding subunit [Paradesulfitobacterium ferrireducens]|uniref:TAXI family TRAP transporter solute-binding subunit n=1 Tax=Paradesulfitobacterium ferrireducens TaxID=2816476 RepID=UPI001A90C5D5|nr:TAXI family TRAP transporter solute-binding subunit [Paradesulfitobacterium ferrireducens]
MKLKRLSIVILLALTFMIYGCGSSTSADNGVKTVQWALGTSGSGSSPYVMGGVLSDVVNKNYKGLNISPQVTAGFEENVGLVANKTIAVAEVNNSQMIKGYEKYQDIRGLFNFQIMPVHVVVDAKKNIKTIQELKGKKINIGAPGQVTRKIAEALLASYGLTSNDYSAAALSTGESLEALKDGQIDAGIVISNPPMPGIAEAAVSKGVDLLAIDGELAAKFNEAMGLTLVPSVIPANTYKGVDHDVHTMAAPVVIIAHKDLDADLVYEFTKTVWSNLDKLKAAHEGFNSLMLDQSAIAGWDKVSMHPGAEKYFKEIGIIK